MGYRLQLKVHTYHIKPYCREVGINMKHIIVNYTGRKGGMALYTLEMTKGIIKNGHAVSAIISEENEFLCEWEKLPLKHLVVISTYHDKMSFFINSLYFYAYKRYQLIKEFRNEKIDYIYCPGFALWSSWINRLFPEISKYVTLHDPKPHSGESLVNRFFCRLYDKEAKKARKIIILSRIFKGYVKKKFDKNDEDVLIVQHGVFSNYKCINRTHPFKYDDDKINFLFFGRIEKYKGIDILLDAYQKLEKKYSDKVTLTIAGNGCFDGYNEKFNSLKNATLINRWIHDDEVDGFFVGKSIIVVLPYIDATQSGVVNIAMQNKALLLATDTGGLSEQLGGGKYGLLVPPNDVKSLYCAMREIVKDYNHYDSIRKAAYEYLSRLHWDKLAASIWNDSL